MIIRTKSPYSYGPNALPADLIKAFQEQWDHFSLQVCVDNCPPPIREGKCM